MVNETQSFSQYKDKAHAITTDSIQRVIGSETYQPKLVQNWVDSVGQDIVNKLRVCGSKICESPPNTLGPLIRVQVHRISDDCREERRFGSIVNMLLGRIG